MLCGYQAADDVTTQVACVGRCSMTVIVDVVAEDLVSGERRLAVRGSFETVAVEAAGRPVAIVKPSTSEFQKDIQS